MTFSLLFFSFFGLCSSISPAPHNIVADTLPDAVIEEWRRSPQPNNISVNTNFPSLLWASEKKNTGKDVLYRIYLSQDAGFSPNTTIQSKQQRFCMFNPHQKLHPGKWYWKYEISDGKKTTTKGVYSFTIAPDAQGLGTPSFETLLSKIKPGHPRVMTQGKNLEDIRKAAPQHPIYEGILEAGTKALRSEIYNGPVQSKDPAIDKALIGKANNQVSLYHDLLEAYVLSGKPELLDALLKRTNVLLQWPTDDLLGSQVLIALAMGYDLLYQDLSPDVKKSILAVVAKQINHGLEKWPGVTEARHVDNHFWQMELPGNFIAALATANDLPASNKMLEYTYELFVTRFPNLSTQEGGWAEGIGYFGVNKTAIVDMALLMKKIAGIDVFQMNWYKNLADYFFYFAPVDGRIDGFGDMHDRVGYGNVGHSMMLVEGIENNDSKALYRLAQLMRAKKQPRESEQWYDKEMKSIEPWYQVVNNIRFNPDKISQPLQMPSAKVFNGVGLAAFHTNVLDSKDNTAVYFRSSPFGAKGHMHANQNAFNISRKGEPIFYSTGYYTTFADPHSLSSYRHTRAHNAILVNGCGQAFGHEGYGWIKRFINSESIGYVCGDATKAYRPTTDPQFLQLTSENNILQTPEFGFGDARLNLFERHTVFLRPDIIVIYDVLESKAASDWTLLLHTMVQPSLDRENLLRLNTNTNYAETFVTGTNPLQAALTDQFAAPPVDIKKKYKSMPNQYHISYKSLSKSKDMRFLTIIQLNDAGTKVQPVSGQNGAYTIGDIRIDAELDTRKPAGVVIKTKEASLFVNRDPQKGSAGQNTYKTVLIENKKGVTQSCSNMPIPSLVD